LAGVLIACFCSIILGFLVPSSTSTNIQCSLISLSGGKQADDGKDTVHTPTGNFTNIPLGLTIITFSFLYFVVIIAKYKIFATNISTIIIFGILIVWEFAWLNTYQCFDIISQIAGFIIGGGIGAMWAFIVMEYGENNMQYYPFGRDDSANCRMVANNVFKCTFNGNQEIVTTKSSAYDVLYDQASHGNIDIKTLAGVLKGQKIDYSIKLPISEIQTKRIMIWDNITYENKFIEYRGDTYRLYSIPQHDHVINLNSKGDDDNAYCSRKRPYFHDIDSNEYLDIVPYIATTDASGNITYVARLDPSRMTDDYADDGGTYVDINIFVGNTPSDIATANTSFTAWKNLAVI